MAKMTVCAICGKEITKGLFKGEDYLLEIASCESVTVCSDCYDALSDAARLHRKRFTKKLENYRWARKSKVKGNDLIPLYRRYLSGYEKRKEALTATPVYEGAFYLFDDDGHFGINEAGMGFVNSDISVKDKLRTLKKGEGCDVFGFTAADVTCLEYRLTNSDFIGLFKKAYSLEIRLNPKEELDFRPVYVKSVVLGGGFAIGYRKNARKKAVALLERFKEDVGVTLPIREVKKFR